MENLFLETNEGKIAIEPEIVDKYSLKKGTKSPFTQNRIVGKNGDYPVEEAKNEININDKGLDIDDNLEGRRFSTDGTDNMDNGLAMSQSEILDFSQGTDSSNR